MQAQGQTQDQPVFGLQEIEDRVAQTERQLADAEASVPEAESTAKQARTDRGVLGLPRARARELPRREAVMAERQRNAEEGKRRAEEAQPKMDAEHHAKVKAERQGDLSAGAAK